MQSGAKRPVMKEPNFLFMLDDVMSRLQPTFGLVLVRRDPVKTVESIFARLGLDAPQELLTVKELHSLPLAWQPIFCGSGGIDTRGKNTLESLSLRISKAEQIFDSVMRQRLAMRSS